ncbi:MAG: ATP-binding protein [Myxococcota bacterium]|jgi:signal transduction histidine kinase|nr:ATP-binding protein [Myxococcota bacterium]
MRNRTHLSLAAQAVMTALLAVLIVFLARKVVREVERTTEEKATTLTRTVVAAIRGVIRHGPDQEGRVQGILSEVGQSPEVLAVGIVDDALTPVAHRGASLPSPDVLRQARPLRASLKDIVVVWPFDVESGCMASGACHCAPGRCACGAQESWAVPAGRYHVVLVLDRTALAGVTWPIVGVAALGVAMLLVLFAVTVAWIRSLAARERLARDMALEQQRRQGLESLRLLSTGLAHEIRNPLGAVRGLAQLIHEQSKDEGSLRHTSLMLHEIDRMVERLEEFLDFARPRKRKENRVDLGELARKTATLLGPDAEAAGLSLEVSVQGRHPIEVVGDASALEELLLNLALNAIEASGSGGRIEIAVEVVGGGPSIRVVDAGRGIAAEDLPRLFQPYFTTKERGSGLGLAISARIAEDHHAVLSLTNGSGQGAVATLTFFREPGERP